ncbi:MAG: aminodeoxychorismate/anthranilate synthase component II [Deltaproteobacteria bacterium]|nr:MAG: aminodeoxychorismate/anthranilate synthase component II [Deltaproteobacteria bacterium]
MHPAAERFEPSTAHRGAFVLVVDNYDSFTFNLVQYLLELGAVVDVVRNDRITAEEIEASGASHVLLSPGPGRPEESRATWDWAQRAVRGSAIPTLGVCLGHQAICGVAGARVGRAERIMHGKTSPVVHDGAGIFAGLPSPFAATRYHSLIVDPDTLPAELRAVATTPEGELMAVAHAHRPVVGVQFHPESILSDHGHRLLENFLDMSGRPG